ncbi:JmjC domain-containing protein [Sandaracinus amylolyticus]|uniref:Cupin 4 n=1 Tax=Sandaracinus amylolyticus TaxID=927083 RepID=A0A0F6W7D6_9BACT|nr:cupin domain-containing protein [Sandaracinus amylolyticus]AKF09305.1 Cupin 4 [Sandaracinus amylolyticus]
MLGEWLAGSSIDRFRAEQLGRAPFASPGTAREAIARFDWDTLDRVLRAPDLDALVVRRGRAEDVALPRDLATLRALFARELGVVVRRAERHDHALAAMAHDLARDVPGEAHVQLFVTPGRSHGFGWHYDAEEVFIAQTAGSKTYYFRRNTIDPDPTPGAQPDFARVREETTPLMSCTLVAGDWLYLPRGWWHVAKAIEDSLSISIGITPPR